MEGKRQRLIDTNQGGKVAAEEAAKHKRPTDTEPRVPQVEKECKTLDGQSPKSRKVVVQPLEGEREYQAP
jgi:hypothetical protein